LNSEKQNTNADMDKNKNYDSDYFRKPFLESYIQNEVKELKNRIFELNRDNEALKEENEHLKDELEHTTELVERWKTQAEVWKNRYDDILDIRKFEDHSHKAETPTRSQSYYSQERSEDRPTYYEPPLPSDESLIDEILNRIQDVLRPYEERGLLQADLQRMLSKFDRRRVGEAIIVGVDNNSLLKIKEGRSFRVKLKTSEQTADDIQLPGAI